MQKRQRYTDAQRQQSARGIVFAIFVIIVIEALVAIAVI